MTRGTKTWSHMHSSILGNPHVTLPFQTSQTDTWRSSHCDLVILWKELPLFRFCFFSKVRLPSLFGISNYTPYAKKHVYVVKRCFKHAPAWWKLSSPISQKEMLWWLQLQIVITRPVNWFWSFLHHFIENCVLSTVIYLKTTKSSNATHMPMYDCRTYGVTPRAFCWGMLLQQQQVTLQAAPTP